MTLSRPSNLLRLALLGDAAASGATGLLMFAGAGPLASLLGLPQDLLRSAGLVLVPYAAFVARLGMREAPSRSLVWAVIAINVLWAAESLLLPLVGWVSPNQLGLAFIVFQAAVVSAFAAAQYAALRRGQPRLATSHG